MKKSVSLTCGHEKLCFSLAHIIKHWISSERKLLLWERKRVEANTSEKETLNSR